MPSDEQANLKDHGLWATHNYPCPMRGCEEISILDLNQGIYGPCLNHSLTIGPPRRLPWYQRLVRREEKRLAKATARRIW